MSETSHEVLQEALNLPAAERADIAAELLASLDVADEPAEVRRRERFAQRAADELAALRSDSEAWADYLADAEATATTDGIG